MQTIGNSVFSGAAGALVIVVVVLGCGWRPNFLSKSSGDFDRIAQDLSKLDPAAGPVSPGAAAIRRLALIVPDVAPLAVRFEEVEIEAITASLKKMEGGSEKSSRLPRPRDPLRHSTGTATMLQVSSEQPSSPDPSKSSDAIFVASGIAVMAGRSITSEYPPGDIGTIPNTVSHGDVKSTLVIERGRDQDGSPVTAQNLTTEITYNGTVVRTELHAKIVGQQCPDANGEVSFKVTARFSGFAGEKGFTQELAADVKATVNDQAKLASGSMELKQGTREVKDGRSIYVESAMTSTDNGSGSDDGTGSVQSNRRQTRRSQDATDEAAAKLDDSGLQAALAAGLGALKAAKLSWFDGGCVKIDASSPGEVAVNSTTTIPVKVVHKFDGADVPSKLEVTLKGEESVSPTSIAKTAGTLTYVAPGEKDKNATISLTATSRRGRATLNLTANTGDKESYHAEGSSSGAFFKGDICDLEKPFTINVDSKTGKWPMNFTPESDSAGQMEGTFSSNGCTLTGGGPYSISIGKDGSGTITFTYNSTATCPAGNRTTSKTSTLPLKPAPDLSCP